MKNENLLCARNARVCARTLLHPAGASPCPEVGTGSSDSQSVVAAKNART